MNGLEAIKYMESTGGIVSRKGTNLILKIEDGLVKSRLLHNREWMLNQQFNFQDEYEEYFEPSPTGWHIADQKINFFMVHADGEVEEERYWHQLDYADEDRFATKEKAERIEFEQRLFRKLQRFSDMNGGNEIDWNDDRQTRFCIAYDYDDRTFYVIRNYNIKFFGAVHFTTEEIAKKAIEIFEDELTKYYTTN